MSWIYACVEKFAKKSLEYWKSLDKHLKKNSPQKSRLPIKKCDDVNRYCNAWVTIFSAVWVLFACDCQFVSCVCLRRESVNCYSIHIKPASHASTGCISKNLTLYKNAHWTKLIVEKWSTLLILQWQLSLD